MTAAGDTHREAAMSTTESVRRERIRSLREDTLISEAEFEAFRSSYARAATGDAVASGRVASAASAFPFSLAARHAAYSDCLEFLSRRHFNFGPHRRDHMQDDAARMEGYTTLGGDFYRLRNGLQAAVSDERWTTRTSDGMRETALEMGPFHLERVGDEQHIVDEETFGSDFTDADRESFFRSYLGAAFSTGPEDDDGYQFDSRFDEDALCATSRDHMVEDCRLFMDACRRELLLAERVEDEYPDLRREGTYSQAGYDFWMSRTGAGVGFWEPGDWPPEVAGILDAAAKHFGEASVIDSGRVVYFEGRTVRAEALAVIVADARAAPRTEAPTARPSPDEAEAEVPAETAPGAVAGPITLGVMEAAVAAGVNFLDNNHAGWEGRVDLPRLRMASGLDDIQGQLGIGDFETALERHYGFRVPLGADLDGAIDPYDVLNLLWKVEIQARLLAVPRVVPSVAPTVASVFAGPRRRGRTAAV